MTITSRRKPIQEIYTQKEFLTYLKTKDTYLYKLSTELKNWFKENKNESFPVVFFYKPLYKEVYGKLPKSKMVPEFWSIRGYSELQSLQKAKAENETNCQKATEEMKNTTPQQRKQRYDSNSKKFHKKKYGDDWEQTYTEKNKERTDKSLKNKTEYWIKQGYTEQEAKQKVKEIQSKRAQDFWDSDESDKRLSQTQVEYWMNKGLSPEQAKRKVSEVQQTFSKEICIAKYGKKEGLLRWQARQDKWQLTLNSKSDEEKERINQKKGLNKDGTPHHGIYNNTIFERDEELSSVNGVLYYVKVTFEDLIFWKIGITKNSTEKRLSIPNKNLEIMFEKRMTLSECFKEEQRILNEYSDFRINIDTCGFKSTECFSQDILKGELP